jgi:hypothetical protein
MMYGKHSILALICLAAAAQNTTRGKRVADIVIATFPKQPVSLPGESLIVETVFANRSNAALGVPSPEGSSPFSYQILTQDTGQERYSVSYDSFRRSIARGPVPVPPVLPPLVLEPNEEVGRTEDLAELTPQPFAPGSYHVVAHWQQDGQHFVSPKGRVRIVQPRIGNYASAVCRSRETLSTAITHVHSDGVTIILQRESMTGMPGYGVFYRRARLKNTIRVTDIATAVDTAPIVGGRWIAWLQDGQISAAKGWGARVDGSAGPVPTNLTDVRLVQPGFQLENASGLFLVAGLSGGAARVQAYEISAQIRKLWESPLGAPLLNRIRARYLSGGIQLFWLDPSRKKIYMQAYRHDGTSLPEPRLMAESASPIQAWDVPAWMPQAGATMHVLSGPDADGSMTYRRLKLGEEGEPGIPDVRFQAPEQTVDEWAISSFEGGSIPVLARIGARILIQRAATPSGWQDVVRDLPGAESLRLLTLDGQSFWAEWLDPVVGVRRALIAR